MTVPAVVGLGVAVICSLYVLIQMRPDLLLTNTTPAGGDMGAHVWGPAYLRDHLLAQGRLTGWTPDWYAGFPAFHFYMVIPALAIVVINSGFTPLVGIPLAAIIIGGAFWFTQDRERAFRYRLLAAVVAILLIGVPYGVAFKLVSVAGLVSFPLAAWAMGRLARAPEPVPAFLSVGSLIFLFDTNFTIYGGNVASTLAGEFAFSISLSLTLLAIGLVIRGMDSNNMRVRAAIVIALVALTHLIPVFFMMVAAVAVVVMGPGVPRLWPVATGVAMALLPVAFADGTSGAVTALAMAAALVTLAASVLAEPEVRRRALWLLVTGPTAVFLSAFWLLPFYLREPFFNDMGWERLNEVGPAMLTIPMKVALPLAAVGAITAIAQRERIGVLFTTTGMVFGAAVANLGEGPLWNARLLPFYYLSIYLLAAVGAAMVVRLAAMGVSESFSRPDRKVIIMASVVGLLAGVIAVGVPLRFLPGGVHNDDGTYRWLAFTSYDRSFVPSWTAWNYSGYEQKSAYREYHNVVTTMAEIGEVNGCGRAMWEYSSDLDRYGTPMALMLLPHWTDGCIGSMEGLYFESSATTPFHFLNQSLLSQKPSRAQRDLPYRDFDIERGISQLQTMGVRYYMAQTDESIAAAREHADLVEVGEAQPFVVFEIGGSELVEALTWEPIVIDEASAAPAGELDTRFDHGWLGQAITVYNDPDQYRALPAEDGPAEWARVAALNLQEGTAIPPATVSNVLVDRSSISFAVDQVGTPILVKVSYFPNWEVEGADGPWRIGPNLMVVVPTETIVELDYGRTTVDWLAIFVTLVGLGALGVLAYLDRRWLTDAQSIDVWGEGDQGWGDSDLAVLTGEHAVIRPPTFDGHQAGDGEQVLMASQGVAGFDGSDAGLGGSDVGPNGSEVGGEVGDEVGGSANGDEPEAGSAEVEIKLSTEVSHEKPNMP
jgi:hypothetical protein